MLHIRYLLLHVAQLLFVTTELVATCHIYSCYALPHAVQLPLVVAYCTVASEVVTTSLTVDTCVDAVKVWGNWT